MPVREYILRNPLRTVNPQSSDDTLASGGCVPYIFAMNRVIYVRVTEEEDRGIRRRAVEHRRSAQRILIETALSGFFSNA
jgi:hypothetical protein